MTGTAVLDASAIAQFLLDAAAHPRVVSILRDEGKDLVVPHLCDLEVASALRSAIQRGELDGKRAVEALDLYQQLPVLRAEHVPILHRILELRDNFSVYDATYVALAEVLRAPFYTADSRLARAASARTDVQVVEV